MTAMHEFAGAYLLDALGEDERRDFERHLAGCAECAAEVARESAAVTRLALAVAVPAPETLRTSVFAAIDETVQEPADQATEATGPRTTPTPTSPLVPNQGTWIRRSQASHGPNRPNGPNRPGSRRTPTGPNRERTTRRVLVLTCAVFGLVAGALAWTTVRVHDRQVAAEKREQAVAAVLTAPDMKTATASMPGGGTLTAYYSSTRGDIVAAHGLPALADGRTYELWYLDGPGRPARPAGTSRFDAPRNVVVLASASLPTGQLAVTVEPSGGSPAPTTPILARVPLS